MYLTHGVIIPAHYMQDKLINVDRLHVNMLTCNLFMLTWDLFFLMLT